MECVRTPKFSISINGELHGFFSSGRGIRQGDPISPYLFTLVMEIFSGILNGQASLPGFKYFWRCKVTRLTYLFFADDVLLFSEAKMESVSLLKDGLQKFSAWSGLNPNDHKSEMYYSGSSIALKNCLLESLSFAEGRLPFQYLGVPIVAKRLSKADCNCLVNTITARAQSWSQRFLSFSGRLQLISSILRAIYNYWASVFILPKSVLNGIERVLRQFLWKGPGLGVGGAKVSWAHVCLPKNEEGLGIRRLLDYNRAAMLKHIWIIFSDKESLWCKWIHSTFLKNKNFWVATKPTVCSLAWKKILDLRPWFLPRSRWRIGDGATVSFWFDPWHTNGPLCKVFSDREIYLSRVSRMAKVRDFCEGHFLPNSVLDRLHTWPDFPPIINPARRDCLTWLCHPSGTFTIASAWNDIRLNGSVVFWHRFVWDRHIIPRHSFLLWLATLKRLPTQVLLLNCRRIADGTCPFCRCRPDSVDHLFFACQVTGSLANFWATKCGLSWRNRTWHETLHWAIRKFGGNHFHHCITRFSFAALCYLIWSERNHIIFRNQTRDSTALQKHLLKVVQDKVSTFKGVDDTARNRRILNSWSCSFSVFS
ncbi:F-box domain-containing protein [Psidium guajava]|nr:F-box domain-containing protein [Psidium guajava]